MQGLSFVGRYFHLGPSRLQPFLSAGCVSRMVHGISAESLQKSYILDEYIRILSPCLYSECLYSSGLRQESHLCSINNAYVLAASDPHGCG